MTPKTFLRLSVLLVGGILSFPAVAADTDSSGTSVEWSYVGTTGPAHWGMLNSAFQLCDTGKEQSPINISRKRIPAAYALKFNYHDAALHIGEDMDNTYEFSKTHTIQNKGYGVQVNFHKDEREFLTFQGEKYELKQFHFHSPSETLWHKQSFPLEIHFVHQGKDGLLVLAVFVKGGQDNQVLKSILEHLPDDENHEYTISGVNVDPEGLLPDNLRYYSYTGSLTTPPCAEGVKWVVLPEPITAAPGQILKIREASGGTNARPVQPMNNRTLYYAVPQN